MKVVINKQYGGFSLSPKAVSKLAELNGKRCYFFTSNLEKGTWTPVSIEEAKKAFRFFAFDAPNPLPSTLWREFKAITREEYERRNRWYEEHSLETRDISRSDPLLVQVVEELGEEANGSCASLKIVEIPDGVEYEIDEYDGMESIHETHRSWG